MSTYNLIDAIVAGDTRGVQNAFESAMAERIADRIDEMQLQVARNMFKEAASMGVEEEVDTGEYGARKSAPSSKEDQEGVFKKHRERMEKLRKEKDIPAPKPIKVHPNAIHVQHVGGGKYKVHAVGSNWADGVQHGEHLTDSELDDFHEMGGKIKHIKTANEEFELDEDVSSSSKIHYEKANGTKPRGMGSWMFSTVPNHAWDADKHGDVSHTVSVRGKFADAAKRAASHFRDKGHQGEIHVLS